VRVLQTALRRLITPNNDDYTQTRDWDTPEDEIYAFLESSAFDFYLALANEVRTQFSDEDYDADLMALAILRQKHKGAKLKRKFILISAREIREFLGDHYAGNAMSTECPNEIDIDIYCGAEITEEMDTCPDCGIPIVWKESKTWSNIYGSADQAIRNHNMIKAQDDLDARVLTAFNLPGFANPLEYDRWTTIKARNGRTAIEETLTYVLKKNHGRAGWLHFLNACKRSVRIEIPDDVADDSIEGTVVV
jgi:hypothetical protein